MMLGLTPLETIRPIPVPGPAVDPGFSLPSPQIDSEDQYWAYRSQSLNKSYPNAIEGDGVYFFGPTDAPEMWVKTGSGWEQGTPKRIIFDEVSRGDPRLVGTGMTKSSGIGTGHIVLLGLLALYLLRGSSQ